MTTRTIAVRASVPPARPARVRVAAAIMALMLISALIAGALFVSTAELIAGQTSDVAQRSGRSRGAVGLAGNRGGARVIRDGVSSAGIGRGTELRVNGDVLTGNRFVARRPRFPVRLLRSRRRCGWMAASPWLTPALTAVGR
jgi:hypothetical protein